MQSPGSEFYSWLSREGTGSPGLRWEWLAAKALVEAKAKAGDTTIKVLDVGCREGEFLDLLVSTAHVTTIGFDLNPDVVEIAASKGHVVSVGTFDEVRALLPSDLAFITLWHVVEHLPNPVELLSSARTLLAEKGMILFSVPVSPMSHELTGVDPLNNPPHHLTRWSEQSVRRLAERLGMNATIEYPRTKPLLYRVVRALVLRAMPAFGVKMRSRKLSKLLYYVACNPKAVIAEVVAQRGRHRVGSGHMPAPDVMLVKLHLEAAS